MKVENEIKIAMPDYKTIRALSRRIDCTIVEADFNTNHPNGMRIDYMISDINRYLKHTGGRRFGFGY
jgi:hypothetical protein